MSKIIDKNILICPCCQSSLLIENMDNLQCENCQRKYRKVKNKYYFFKFKISVQKDALDKVKSLFKKYWRLYDFSINLFSPVCPSMDLRKFIKKYIEKKNIIALNIGSGNSNISDNVSNLDIFPYENVDLTCDIENMPIKDNTVDAIINIAVLEHVINPEKAIREIWRILKKGGIIFSFFPFIQPFHASPNDYSRRTFEGMKLFYGDFKIIELKNAGGPTSGFLWIFQEWLAIVLSFGIQPVYQILSILLMILTFPIKFLDILFRHYPMAKNISSGFIYIGRKK